MNPPESAPPQPAPPPKAQFSGPGCWLIAVLGLVLLVLSIPHFLSKRKFVSHSSCIANLKQIDGAVQQWALEHKKTATDTYSLSDPALLAYMRGSVLPVCPKGGRYTAGNNVGDVPKCSFAASGHTL